MASIGNCAGIEPAADGGCTVQGWIWSGWVAVLIGGLAFVLCFVPIVVWQYRKFGRPSAARVLGAGAVSIYAVALVSYTMLPLPRTYPGWCAEMPDKSPQLVPFHFVEVVATETAGSAPWGIFSNFYALQVLFNVLLFIPWGVIARRYFSRGIWAATVSGFLASLTIESTQYTGIWGIYGCAYRLADVDDLLMNTTGALLGAVLAPLLLWWMPKRGELAAGRNLPRPVTSRRRWFGMFLDAGLFVVLAYLSVAAASLSIWLVGADVPGRLGSSIIADIGQTDRAASPVVAFGVVAAGLLVFYLPSLFGSGASLGQRIVWLSPAWPRRSLLRRLGRASVSGGALTISGVLAALFPSTGWLPLGLALIGLVLLLSLVLVPFSKGKRGLSYRLSGAELVDSRSIPQPGNLK